MELVPYSAKDFLIILNFRLCYNKQRLGNFGIDWNLELPNLHPVTSNAFCKCTIEKARTAFKSLENL